MRSTAQISVTATAGDTGPTAYTNLRLAFAAVNSGTHQGDITVEVTADPAADNNTAVINASGSGAADYTSVLVRPAGTAGARTISGTIHAGPLVDLNGADNVTIDGRTGDGYTLTISNQSTSSSAGTSTIRFINDAAGNTITDVAILGRSTGTVATLSGNVVFSTGSSTGNDDNSITDCTIANDGDSTTDLISKAIVSVGSTGSLAAHNSGNSITDCLVHDFFLASGSRGVMLGAGNHAWTISGNRFYQGAARSSASATNQHHVIDVTSGSATDAGGHVIDGNTIGHANASGTGTWTLSGNATVFRAIRVDLPNTAPRGSISGNTIAGIEHTTASSGTDGSSPSTLIHVLGGPMDVHGNTIGVQGATGSIVFTPSTTGRHFHAILNSGSNDWSTAHNTLGGISVEGSAGLYAIRSTAAGQWQCDSNLVGGTVANSLWMSGTHSSAVVHGISSSDATLHATGNTVRNLGSAGQSTATVIGIHSSGGQLVAVQDTIMLLSSAAWARAIAAEGATLTATGNAISNIQGSNIDGIHVTDAPATLSMNSISDLAGTVTGSANTTVYGIYASGDSLTASDNTINGLSNPATGSNARTRGVHVANGVLNASDNTVSELVAIMVDGMYATQTAVVATDNTIQDLSSNGTTQHAMVNGIVVLGDTAVLAGNTVEDLDNATTGSLARTRGIHATDAVLTATGNAITDLNTGRNMDGISASGGKATLSGNIITSLLGGYINGIHVVDAPATLSMNSISTLHCSETGNSSTSVYGIYASGDSINATGNTITGLSNAAVGSNARSRGVHVANGILNASDNTISELVAIMVDGMYATQTAVVATDNTILDLSSNGTTQHAMVNGIVLLGDTAVLIGNTVEDLDNGTTGSLARTRGIQATDVYLSATGNAISHLNSLWKTEGISLTNGVAELAGNTLDHFRSVYIDGILATAVVLHAADNSITDLVSTGTTQNVTVHGIFTTGGVLTSTGNTIQGLSSTSTSAAARVMGILCTDGMLTASGDSIAGLGAINVHGINALRTPMHVSGTTIHDLAGTGSTQNALVNGIVGTDSTLIATGNVITDLSNTATGSTAATRGILVTNAPLTATGNTIAKLSGNGTGTTVPGVAGIAAENSSGTPLVLLRSNTIHSLYSTHATNTGQVHGIHARLRDTTNLIEANLIHSLWRSTSSTGANPGRGIHLAEGRSTLRNNMIRLGLDSAGSSVNAPHVFEGIHVAAGEHAILHNTVYIGGTVTTASSNHTYALFSATTGTRDHRNNILWNARSNGAGSAKHYAVGVNASLTGLTSDHNCLYVSGTGGHVGREGTTDRTTLSAWQSATSLDGNSVSVDPGLVRPLGDATEVDLHIQHNSAGAAAISRAGATGTGVLHDFDGAQRHSPPDMGADQILLVLPDFYEEPENRNIGYRRNKGQVADNDGTPQPGIKFYSEGGFPRTYLHDDASFSLVALWQDTLEATPDTTWRVDVRFAGDKVRTTAPQAVDLTGYHHNYYLPWCGPNGAEQVHAFTRVVYEDIYPHTDVHFYSGSGGLKMAFVIRPGGDLANIHLEFDGQDSLTVDGSGFLVAHIGNMSFPLIGGIAYQVDGGTIIPVGVTTYLNSAGSPEVDMGMSLFSAPADPELPLVILVSPPPMGGGGLIETPGLCWSTYFGGDGQDAINASTEDASDNYFVAGSTGSGEIRFPWAPGTQTYGVPFGTMAYVVKMDHLDRMVWRTFLGGNGIGNTSATSIATKENPIPKVYIAGNTTVDGLATWPDGNAYFQGTLPSGTTVGFLASFETEDGTQVWTTYFGEQHLLINGMAKDGDERLFITGRVQGGLPDTQDPTHPDSEDYDYGGAQDAFIAMFNTNDRLQWRSFYGGSGNDQAKEVVIGNGKVVIAGDTDSGNMITVYGGSNALNETYTGEIRECFVAEFDLDGAQQWGTCFAADQHISLSIMDMLGKGLALDPTTGDIVIGGTVFSIGLPIVPGPGWYDDTANQGTINGFLARFSGTDRSLLWSTYVAGSGRNEIEALYFDGTGNLFVAGRTGDVDLDVRELSGIYYADEIQVDLFDPQTPELSDAFIMSFTPDHWLAWCTYFGGEAGTAHERIRTMLRRNGDLYAGGFTSKSPAHFVGPYFESYFPLHDPDVPGVHFEEFYGDLLSPTTDGFITRFCGSAITGVHNHVTGAATPIRAWQNGDLIVIADLPAGRHRLLVVDAAGRVVGIETVVSDGTQGSIRRRLWADGVYSLVLPDLGKHARLFMAR